MLPPKIIYLDIDGVLNLMPLEALSFVVGKTIKIYPLPGNYDLVGACNVLLKKYITAEEFWSKLDRKFWRQLSVSDECSWLIEMCAQMVGKTNVFLFTVPIKDPDCMAGKMEWIYDKMPQWLHHQFLIGPHKWLCAKPDALLIDDYDKNIEQFAANGGQTILVPRPWNKGVNQW